MKSPFIPTRKVAEVAQVAPTTINKWTCRNKKTGEKYKPGFPDQCHKGFYKTQEIEDFFGITL
ncbi:hypothetical protein [Rouxiella sp. WC2420]|uniref:DNA-binding protein n=1 Tax=Rouxiella sp. WC2420 TaxID=3234145 RepID=A0AB39VMK1_9GAMM